MARSVGAYFARAANIGALATVSTVGFEIDANTVAFGGSCWAKAASLLADLVAHTGASAATAVLDVGLEVDATSFADVGCGGGAGDGAGSVVAEFAFVADGATCSTVGAVGASVGANAATDALSCRTLAFTLCAHLAAGASVAACATVGLTGLGVDAGTSATCRGVFGAGDLTLALRAHFSQTTGRSASAAVLSAGLEVYARAAAIGLSSVAYTGSSFADLTGRTGSAALAAVLAIGLQVDTTSLACIGSPFGAGCGALTCVTNFAISASLVTSTAVFAVGLNVDTLATTDLLTGGAGERTGTGFADFAVFADVVTSAAVFSAGLQVDASAVAVALPRCAL